MQTWDGRSNVFRATYHPSLGPVGTAKVGFVPRSAAVRHCNGCDRDLPLNGDYFYRQKTEWGHGRKGGGYHSKCKECRRRLAQAYYQTTVKPRRQAA